MHTFIGHVSVFPIKATVAIRLLLVPLIIDQRRKLAGYTNMMPQISVLQNRMTKARLASNYIESMFWYHKKRGAAKSAAAYFCHL